MSPEEFKEWREMPVTEWVFAQVEKYGVQQHAHWAALAWSSGDVNEALFNESRVRADAYRALSQSSFDDWKAIDDSED